MNILITNDDGIFAEGLRILAQGIASLKEHRIYICAPDRERSCIGHGLTMKEQLTLKDWPLSDFAEGVVWAKSCSGTPADCVRVGLCALQDEGVSIDLVCAGVNNGANLGSDINYSGTMGACREAVIDCIPSIGFSTSHGKDYIDNFLKIVPFVVKSFIGKIPEQHMVNVNAKDLPWEELKGYKAASLSHITYPNLYRIRDSKGDATTYDFASFEVRYITNDDDCDVSAYNSNYIAVSLVPLLQDAKSTMGMVNEALKL